MPVERLSRLIDEHQFDLYNDPMPTKAALEGYIDDTSSALFSLGAAIAGRQSAEIEHLARHAGLAQGIAQVMAALPLDASRRQLFVPLQLLESHGSSMEEVFAGKQTPTLRAALDQLVGEAQGTFEDGVCAAGAGAAGGEAGVPAAGAGRPRSERMARADNDPFVPRVTSRLRTLVDVVAGVAVAGVSKRRADGAHRRVVMPAKAGIQYAAASVHREPNTGSPAFAGDDSEPAAPDPPLQN